MQIDGGNTTKFVQLFPNPDANTAVVNIPGTGHQQLSITVYDAAGKQVRHYPHVHGPTFTFSRGDLPHGLYLMQVQNEQRILGHVKFGVR